MKMFSVASAREHYPLFPFFSRFFLFFFERNIQMKVHVRRRSVSLLFHSRIVHFGHCSLHLRPYTHTYTIHTSIVHCALIIQFPFHFMFRPCPFPCRGHSHADFCAFRHPHCPRNIHHNHNDSTRFHVNERMSGRYCDRTNATSAKVFSAHPVRIWDIFWMWTTGWRDKLLWRSIVHCAVSFVWFIGFCQCKNMKSTDRFTVWMRANKPRGEDYWRPHSTQSNTNRRIALTPSREQLVAIA